MGKKGQPSFLEYPQFYSKHLSVSIKQFSSKIRQSLGLPGLIGSISLMQVWLHSSHK